MKPAYWAALAAALAAVGLVWWQTTQTLGPPGPPPQPQPELFPDVALQPTHQCPTYLHPGPMTATRHRYPQQVAGEVTAAIHNGWAPMRIPNERDVQWMIAPPSEVSL